MPASLPFKFSASFYLFLAFAFLVVPIIALRGARALSGDRRGWARPAACWLTVAVAAWLLFWCGDMWLIILYVPMATVVISLFYDSLSKWSAAALGVALPLAGVLASALLFDLWFA